MQPVLMVVACASMGLPSSTATCREDCDCICGLCAVQCLHCTWWNGGALVLHGCDWFYGTNARMHHMHSQTYLKLLNTGRLASKKKLDRAQSDGTRPWPRPNSGDGEPGSPAEEQLKSVWESELNRLRSSTQALDMQPLRTRSASARRGTSSRPGTSGSDNGTRSPRMRTSRSGSGSPSPRPTASLAGGASSASPFKKLYTPGPGAYSPHTNRYGRAEASSFGFGTARQRPPNTCIQDNIFSPGPIYLPSKESTSLCTNPVQYRFGKHFVGSRFDASAEMPSNSPHWNPGPANYEPAMLPTGKIRAPGADAPRPVFGSSQKLVSAEINFSATVFVSHGHARRENVGVHSPGPAAYSPDTSPTRAAAATYSLGAKAPSYFDIYLDPTRQLSPGPQYASQLDRTGKRTWGAEPRATFGKGPKAWEPEVNLSAAPFISKAHAPHVNQGVHSPGPGRYSPEVCKPVHVPAPMINSGPSDRFYSRFEPGRIQ